MAKNKIIFGEEVLIDLTGDTVSADKLEKGITAHDKTGAIITGTSTKDSDTSDATAAVSEILVGKTAYARGAKLTGTMPDNSNFSDSISTIDQEITIPMGFTDGSVKIGIAQSERDKFSESILKSGVEFLGKVGTYTGEGAELQSKTVTPSMQQQTVKPDEGFDALSMVTVEAIPYTESENSAGGTTVTIGA